MEIFLLLVILILVIVSNSNQTKNLKKTNSLLRDVLFHLQHSKGKSDTEKEETNENEAQETSFLSSILETEFDPVEETQDSIDEAESIEEEPVTAASSFNEVIGAPNSKDNVENDAVLESSADNTFNEAKESKSFLQRNPDLEKFIGENLINKIGIAILVLGIGFFVKYAIDQNWINEVARVGIGLLCGAVLIGIAHRIRSSYKSFSSVLIGGGIAVFYFTIGIAFHQYHIMNVTTAFTSMVLITAFSILITLYYNRLELAVISLLGGFATPFILSTGDGNYIFLFTYLLILNTGMLVMAFFKKWNLINVLSYILTVLIFGGWMLQQITNIERPPYEDMLLFSSLFYVVFFLMNIANNVLANRVFKNLEIGILLSNTFLYYSVGMTSLHIIADGQYQGLFTAIIAIINFVFAYVLNRYKKVDQNLLYLLIGLVLTFVSLAGPVQLEGNYITLFWAAEAVLLLWLASKSKNKLMFLISMIINMLMIISLILDWIQLYFLGNESLNPFLNKGFTTGLFAFISLILSGLLLSKSTIETDFENKKDDSSTLATLLGMFGFEVDYYKQILGGLTIAVLYFTGLIECNYQLDQHLGFYPMRSVILASYHFAFFICLTLFSMRKKNAALVDFSVVLLIISLIAQITFYNQQIIEVRNQYLLNAPFYFKGFLYHYLDVILVLSILALLIYQIKHGLSFLSIIMKQSVSVISVYLLILLSMELDHFMLWLNYEEGVSFDLLLNHSHKIGFPILWGVLAFVIMWLGMKFKIRHMRITSLLILLITLVKLFAFDIRNVSEAGKILAFICLGVLLLVISFMYQKLKKLIVDDESLKNQ